MGAITDRINNELNAGLVIEAYKALRNLGATMPTIEGSTESPWNTSNLVSTIKTLNPTFLSGKNISIDLSTNIIEGLDVEFKYINALGYNYNASTNSLLEGDYKNIFKALGENSHVEGDKAYDYSSSTDLSNSNIYYKDSKYYLANNETQEIDDDINDGDILKIVKIEDDLEIFKYYCYINGEPEKIYNEDTYQLIRININPIFNTNNIDLSNGIYKYYKYSIKGFALGKNSHVEGSNNLTMGVAAHAEGEYTSAYANASHTEGRSTKATGIYSHAEGYHTIAGNDESHVEGYYTQANGLVSHAEGYHTIANGDYLHVGGKYNIPDNNGTLFMIGNGSDNNSRSNAYKLKDTGSSTLSGTAFAKDFKTNIVVGRAIPFKAAAGMRYYVEAGHYISFLMSTRGTRIDKRSFFVDILMPLHLQESVNLIYPKGYADIDKKGNYIHPLSDFHIVYMKSITGESLIFDDIIFDFKHNVLKINIEYYYNIKGLLINIPNKFSLRSFLSDDTYRDNMVLKIGHKLNISTNSEYLDIINGKVTCIKKCEAEIVSIEKYQLLTNDGVLLKKNKDYSKFQPILYLGTLKHINKKYIFKASHNKHIAPRIWRRTNNKCGWEWGDVKNIFKKRTRFTKYTFLQICNKSRKGLTILVIPIVRGYQSIYYKMYYRAMVKCKSHQALIFYKSIAKELN